MFTSLAHQNEPTYDTASACTLVVNDQMTNTTAKGFNQGGNLKMNGITCPYMTTPSNSLKDCQISADTTKLTLSSSTIYVSNVGMASSDGIRRTVDGFFTAASEKKQKFMDGLPFRVAFPPINLPPLKPLGWILKIFLFFMHCIVHFFVYVIPMSMMIIFVDFPIVVFYKISLGTNYATLMEMRRCTALRLETKFKDPEIMFDLTSDDQLFTVNNCDGVKDTDVPSLSKECTSRKENEKEINNDVTFDGIALVPSPLKVFGFEYSKCLGLHELGFSTEDYPGPIYSGHLHSIFGAVVRRSMRKIEMNYDREYVRSEFDGCTLVLDWRYAKGVAVALSKFTKVSLVQSHGTHVGITDSESKEIEGINAVDSHYPEREAYSQSNVAYLNHKIVTIETDDNSNETPKKPLLRQAKGIIVIVPGLCSDQKSNYIQRYIVHASENGFHCVLIGTRGMGGNPLDKPLISSAAFAHDVQSVIGCHLTEKYIIERFGYLNPADDDRFDGISDEQANVLWRECQNEETHNKSHYPSDRGNPNIMSRRTLPILLLGFSIGGCLAIRCLAEAQHSTRVHAAVAVCSPWDFLETANNFCRPITMKLYNTSFTGSLVEYAMKHRSVLTEQHPDPSVRDHLTKLFKDIETRKVKLSSVMEYDTLIVCPIYGFKDLHEYYSTSSAWVFIKDVKIPLLCISAIDDPITGPPPHIKRWEGLCNANPNILFVTCPTGGHLGFVQGPIDELLEKPNFMETRIVKALTTAARQSLVASKDYHKWKGNTSPLVALHRPLKNTPQNDSERYMRYKGTRTYMEYLERKDAEQKPSTDEVT